MPGLAFINYRRDETSQIAQALYMQLKESFGAGQLFLDVNSIRIGEEWPNRIKHKLETATVVLALIGPGWLTTMNKHGKRRIDDPSDWVRKELVYAIEKKTPIVPIVINHKQNLPDAAGLPPKLRSLNLAQAKVLHLDPAEWRADLLVLSRELLNFGLRQERLHWQPPSLKKQEEARPLSEDELAGALKTLPEWEEWVDALALEYPLERHELRRTFMFDSFLEAIEFMKEIAPLCEDAQHHPRWGNEANELRIRFTTWDAGNKITHHDVKAALMVDNAYREFKARRKNGKSGSPV
jgi:pterin-4a-carbinolamine dehydratase